MSLHITVLKLTQGFSLYYNLNISVAVLLVCVLLLKSAVMNCTVLFSVCIRSLGQKNNGL